MIKSKIFPIIFITLVTCLIFFKIFSRGLYPIPGDLLVSFYFPWYSGNWQGYNPWTTHKELLNADSIRQIYPWKEFAVREFKKGNFPLWNPYTFSGQPLAANFQSSVYYPFNIFYFLLDPKNAWIVLIIMQPFLGGIFMYLLVRSFKQSRTASLFASVAFMFSSYLITWMENGNIGNSYIWLPLAFFSIIKYFQHAKFRYILILSLSLALSILGGHPQTAIYIYIATFLFWIYKSREGRRKYFSSTLIFLFAALSSLLVSSIQIIPTAYFYKVSPISLPFSKEVFDRSILPFQNLVTFFASDFFGHPGNNNFWSFSYGDFTPYFGVVPLIFSLWAIIKLWKNNFVKFASVASAFFIICAVNGPITAFIKVAKIPLIDSTTPSRFISISIFLMVILSAFGVGDFLKNLKDIKYQKRFLRFLFPILALYAFLWVFAVFGTKFLPQTEIWSINLAVTRRNLILPTLMFLSIFGLTSGLIFISPVKKFGYLISVCGIFFVTLLGGVYFSNKFMPTAPKSFIFPDHPLFNWLSTSAGLDRFYGGGTAHIDFNFPTHYQIYGAEGYDTLRLERYAQLLASSFSGSVPKTYLRSDGVFPSAENGYRKRLFELLGVKYLLDKEDNPKTGSDWHYERFSGDSVEGFWQYDKFQVYRRREVLPRIFQTTKYYVAKNDSDIIQKIYDPNYDLRRIIIEKDPPLTITESSGDLVIPKVEKYDSDQILISTSDKSSSLLFLSDAYDKDWNVYIDSQKSQILRANYALRAVAVPSGNHQVAFKYQPKSFTLGALATLFSIVGLAAISAYLVKKKKF
ncbi:MAG: YfhO family protein [Candidatus Curtissbacteria bacterium]|nr:YfhO family protein [Candidatus Curtissbacteria bacterium]